MIRRIVPAFAALALAAAMVLLTGCAAEQQVNAAQRAVDSAKAAGADTLAVYEYASAEIYLAQAIEQLHLSDFDAASTYANKARSQATLAEQKAREAHAKPMVPWSIAHPEGATVAPQPAGIRKTTPAAGAPETKAPPPAKPATPAKPTPAPGTSKPTPAPAKPAAAAAPGAAPATPAAPPKPKKKVSDEYPLGEPDAAPAQ